MQTIKVGTNTIVYDPSSLKVTINGIHVTGYTFGEYIEMIHPYKFKPRSSRQEMFVRDNEDGCKIFSDVSCVLSKDIDIVPSKDGWLRVRPAFNEKEVKVIRNYLKMVEEV